jgi:hypothetical protein
MYRHLHDREERNTVNSVSWVSAITDHGWLIVGKQTDRLFEDVPWNCFPLKWTWWLRQGLRHIYTMSVNEWSLLMINLSILVIVKQRSCCSLAHKTMRSDETEQNLSRVGGYAWRKWRVLVRMIGFISTLITHSFNCTQIHKQYSDIADLHTLQFTVAHALGFSVSTSRLLATDL